MISSQLVLFSLLKESLFGIHQKLPDIIDWEGVLRESEHQAVIGLVIQCINNKIGEDIECSCLAKSDFFNICNIESQIHVNFIRTFHAQNELISLYEKQGIPIVILKGFAVAIYYPHPSRRMMGDIDFLVPTDCFEDARKLMEESGYKKTNENDIENVREITYFKNSIIFDLHHHVSTFDIDIDSTIIQGLNNSIRGHIAGVEFPMLPPLENGLSLLTHIRQHLIVDAYCLGLRQIIDWMMYVNHYCGKLMPDGVMWDDSFLLLVTRYGLDTLAITVTYICKTWLGLPNAPDWCNNADHQISAELLEMIMAGGNFGRKIQRNNIKIKQGIVLYRHEGLFNRLQNNGMNNWELAKKYSFLRPFACIYQVCRIGKLGVKEFLTSRTGVRQIIDGYKKSKLIKRLNI